jgi:hypothetical protein
VRTLLFLVTAFVGIAPLYAQEGAPRSADRDAARSTADTTRVTIPFIRRPGERRTIRLVKTQAEREGGVLVDSVRRSWLVDTRVLASRPRGYTMAWTYRSEGEEGGGQGPRFDLTTNTLEGVPIVFRTDATGQPYEIANGDSLRANIRRALRRQAPRLGPQQRAVLDHVRATAATDAGLEAMLLADAERLYLASGARYSVGVPETYRTALPNPFGGAPIPAVARVRLERIGARDSVATVRWQQTPDAQALARILVELLAEVSPGRPQLSPSEIARRFGIDEEATYRVGVKRGEVWSVRYRKGVRFGDRLRTEGVTMEALRPGSREPARGTSPR